MFLAMTPDDPGVMGNLPRSRPGRRSSKRGGTGGGGTSGDGAAKPKAAKSTAAKKTTASRPAKRRSTSGAKAGSAPRPRARAQQRTKPPAASQSPPQADVRGSTDPVTGAVMLAGKVVEGGLKVAGGILKRLPRP
jgi:hypothetical protein